MSDNDELIRQVRDALSHLYDYAYLQRHPLADSLVPASAITTRTRAQELRQILLDAIEALNPGDSVPIRAVERRAYAILFGMYVEGRERREVAASIGVSGRQLRRDRIAAFEALASILQDRYLRGTETGSPLFITEPVKAQGEWLPAQREPLNLSDTVAGLLPVLERMAFERGVELTSAVPSTLPRLYTNRTLIRQALITLASHAMTNLPLARLSFEARAGRESVDVALRLDYRPRRNSVGDTGLSLACVFKPVQALVEALEGDLYEETVRPGIDIIWLSLPRQNETLVLVVDDNQELFALFQRYVADHPYQLMHAASVNQALTTLETITPGVITLDLMMPDRDGWDLLQALRSDGLTEQIPIVVCSILDDPELAYAWGAQGYLKKPVGPVAFLQALAQAAQPA